MKRLGILASAGVLLAVVSACATVPDSNPPQQPQPPVSEAPTQPGEPEAQPGLTPPEGSTPLPAAKVDATALPETYPRTLWTADDGKTVGLIATEGGCGKASTEIVEQAAAQVVVNVVETSPAPEKQVQCTMDIRYPKLTVNLDQPLGERKVILRTEQRSS